MALKTDEVALGEVRCAHCRQPKTEHIRRLMTFQMHQHIWQPSLLAWRFDAHDCPICEFEYPECCVAPEQRP